MKGHSVWNEAAWIETRRAGAGDGFPSPALAGKLEGHQCLRPQTLLHVFSKN